MAAEQRLSQVLTKKLGFYVPISEIGYETIWFMKEEVDETLVSPHIIEHLVEPTIADSASYTDADGNYYLVIIIETGNPDPYEVWLVMFKKLATYASTSIIAILIYMEEKKQQPAKRVDSVQVKLVTEKAILYKIRRIRSSQDAYELMKEFLGNVDREHFIVLCLDKKNQPACIQTVHIGSLIVR